MTSPEQPSAPTPEQSRRRLLAEMASISQGPTAVFQDVVDRPHAMLDSGHAYWPEALSAGDFSNPVTCSVVSYIFQDQRQYSLALYDGYTSFVASYEAEPHSAQLASLDETDRHTDDSLADLLASFQHDPNTLEWAADTACTDPYLLGMLPYEPFDTRYGVYDDRDE